jgi:protein TonB
MSAQTIRLHGYGAPELKACATQSMAVGATGSALLMVTAALATLLVLHAVSGLAPPLTRIVITVDPEVRPPSIHDVPIPRAPAPKPVAPPADGIVVPTPEDLAVPGRTLPTRDELSRDARPATPGDDGGIVISRPPEPELPKVNDYVYYEDPPKVLKAVMPAYPEIAKQAGLEGLVTLKLLVGTDGRVLGVVVLDGMPVLNEAAIQAARQYLFQPALSSGRPVAVWVAVPFRFRLDGR